MFQKTRFLVENTLKRYLINSIRLPDLKKNANGGITLYLQERSPGAGLESNWLPAPDGPKGGIASMPKPEAINDTGVAPLIRSLLRPNLSPNFSDTTDVVTDQPKAEVTTRAPW